MNRAADSVAGVLSLVPPAQASRAPVPLSKVAAALHGAVTAGRPRKYVRGPRGARELERLSLAGAPTSARFVFLTIQQFMSRNGTGAWPSVREIGRLCGYRPNTVSEAVAWLVAHRFLIAEKSRGRATRYSLGVTLTDTPRESKCIGEGAKCIGERVKVYRSSLQIIEDHIRSEEKSSHIKCDQKKPQKKTKDEPLPGWWAPWERNGHG